MSGHPGRQWRRQAAKGGEGGNGATGTAGITGGTRLPLIQVGTTTTFRGQAGGVALTPDGTRAYVAQRGNCRCR